jgi:hypothetical protein
MTVSCHAFVVRVPYDPCARSVRPGGRRAREGSGGADYGGRRRAFGPFRALARMLLR